MARSSRRPIVRKGVRGLGWVLAALTALTALAGYNPDRASATDPRRPGFRILAVGLASSGGSQSSAFLPISSRNVQVPTSSDLASCAGAITASARLPTGPIRSIRLELRAACVGAVTLTQDGCPRARVTIALGDGIELASEQGEVVVEGIDIQRGGMVCGRFSMTVVRGGDPMAFRGTFAIPVR